MRFRGWNRSRHGERRMEMRWHPCSRPRCRAQRFRRDRGIAGGQPALQLREKDLLPRPLRADDRAQKGIIIGIDIRGMKGPRIVAADLGRGFDHDDPQIRAMLRQAQGDQAVGKSAANKDHRAVKSACLPVLLHDVTLPHERRPASGDKHEAAPLRTDSMTAGSLNTVVAPAPVGLPWKIRPTPAGSFACRDSR